MLKQTPFHARTAPLCQAQNWRRWAGYIVASSYELTHEAEYWAIRNSAALLDVSPLYKYRVTGPDAERLLNRMVTRDVRRLLPGRVAYTPWCDGHGKVLDDGTIQRFEADSFRLTAADPNLRWLHENSFGMNVTIADESEQIAALALQGPTSLAILSQLADADLISLPYFGLIATTLGGIPVEITRTGYTGDLGYEIWLPADRAVDLWDLLMEVGAAYYILPAGMLALDMARVEAGLLLIEVDYLSARHAQIPAQTSTPDELGLGWTVALDKGNFVGRAAIRAEREQGRTWGFVGVAVDWDSLHALYAEHRLPPQLPTAAWRASIPLYAEGRQIGYASSGCWSPLLKQYIALAHLQEPYTQVGWPLEIEMTVEHQRRRARAEVVPTPFFAPARKRKIAEQVR